MNVKEYFVSIDKMAEDDKNAACCELISKIRTEGETMTEQALNLLMDKLENLLVAGTEVYASVTPEANGDASFHFVQDENGGKWVYAILNEEDMKHINQPELFTRLRFLNLIDLMSETENDCGIELIASADKSLVAPPAYVKDLAERIVRD